MQIQKKNPTPRKTKQINQGLGLGYVFSTSSRLLVPVNHKFYFEKHELND